MRRRPRLAVPAIGCLLAAMALVATALAQEDFDRRALERMETPPLGLPPLSLPADSAPTAARIALGRKLFFDRRLWRNGTMSCGICHIPEQGFTNNELARPIGTEGRSIRRNAPSLFNVAYQESLFHDGRETRLETQVIGPLLARVEMANPSIGYLIARIESLPDYAGRFEAAFGGGPTIGRLGSAIASYERSLLSANAPFDRWRYGGEATAMKPAARAGFALFTGKAGCAACHMIGDDHALFTDQQFHDTGLGYRDQRLRPADRGPVPVEIAPGVAVPVPRSVIESVGLPPESDLGRHEVTLDPADLWKFKTPSLRNVAVTAPYMHDGSLTTLEQVVRFYDRGGIAHPGLDPLIRPLGLEDNEVAALVAFLESLTGDNLAALVADARSVAVGN
ncbi:MAG: c-type cytochrome [Rhodospirillales bacterium]|nr:c-type cytochrome [Rhodospirillales bacterium]